MKHLVGKPITMSITPEGLLYSIVVDEHTVEILNLASVNTFEMCIVPTAMSDVLSLEPIEYDSLIEALSDADEILNEWTENSEPQ